MEPTELLEKAKRDYPKGTVFKPLAILWSYEKLTSKGIFIQNAGGVYVDVQEHDHFAWVFFQDDWAEIIQPTIPPEHDPDTQKRIILEEMQKGQAMTGWYMATKLGILNYKARISEMRQAGHLIYGKYLRHGKKRFKTYYMYIGTNCEVYGKQCKNERKETNTAMELTKEQKLDALNRAYEDFCMDHNPDGICVYVADLLLCSVWDISIFIPEFIRPHDAFSRSSYWWRFDEEGYQSRKQYLIDLYFKILRS